MPRRAALVTQADIARAIRAAQAAGLPVVRIVVRSDGVSVETEQTITERNDRSSEEQIADSAREVIL